MKNTFLKLFRFCRSFPESAPQFKEGDYVTVTSRNRGRLISWGRIGAKNPHHLSDEILVEFNDGHSAYFPPSEIEKLNEEQK